MQSLCSFTRVGMKNAPTWRPGLSRQFALTRDRPWGGEKQCLVSGQVAFRFGDGALATPSVILAVIRSHGCVGTQR